MAEGTAIQTLNDRIADKVGRELVDLIPEEQWKALIQRESDKFLRDTAPKVIAETLTQDLKAKLGVFVDTLAHTDTYNEVTGEYFNKYVSEMLGAAGGEMMRSMLMPVSQSFINNLRSALSNRY